MIQNKICFKCKGIFRLVQLHEKQKLIGTFGLDAMYWAASSGLMSEILGLRIPITVAYKDHEESERRTIADASDHTLRSRCPGQLSLSRSLHIMHRPIHSVEKYDGISSELGGFSDHGHDLFRQSIISFNQNRHASITPLEIFVLFNLTTQH